MEAVEKLGVKETKEAVVAFIDIAILLAEKFKDGVQIADAAEIYEKLKADEVLSAKLIEAYKDIELVPHEVKDLDLPEGVELVMAAAPGVIKLAQAVAK